MINSVKRKYSILFTIILLTISIYSSAQEMKYIELIYGKWKLTNIKSNNKDSSKIIIGNEGKSESAELLVEFRRSGHGFDYKLNSDFNYSLNGDLLMMGNRKYKIIKLDQHILILEEIGDELTLFINKYTFNKRDD